MKLSQWAKNNGLHYNTAYRLFKNNQLPVDAIQLSTGTILVKENQNVNTIKNKNVSIYARVSSYDKKDDLERQIQRCVNFCSSNGYTIKNITKEIASGMNDKRPKLIKLLNSKPQCILVENKDRLTRFGFNYFEQLLPHINCELIVMNPNDNEENDLMKDLISVITSFCCRLYGLRKGQNKASKIKKELIEL